MKNLKRVLVAILAVLAFSAPAQAQFFRWGIRAGVNINSLNFNSVKSAAYDIIDSDNRAGFTGGLCAEFNVPVIGVGFDLAVMYSHRNSQFTVEETTGTGASASTTQTPHSPNADFISLPINFKYKLDLPMINRVLVPYVFTGPDFAFKIANTKSALENRTFDIAWNIGLGLQFFNHLQLAANYGIGINKVAKYVPENINPGVTAEPIEGRNNCWTITAAWLF